MVGQYIEGLTISSHTNASILLEGTEAIPVKSINKGFLRKVLFTAGWRSVTGSGKGAAGNGII